MPAPAIYNIFTENLVAKLRPRSVCRPVQTAKRCKACIDKRHLYENTDDVCVLLRIERTHTPTVRRWHKDAHIPFICQRPSIREFLLNVIQLMLQLFPRQAAPFFQRIEYLKKQV